MIYIYRLGSVYTSAARCCFSDGKNTSCDYQRGTAQWAHTWSCKQVPSTP